MIEEIRRTSQFKKDFKLVLKQGLDQDEFREVMKYLIAMQPLPEIYNDHKLANSKYFKNCRECHIQNDWLLIYRVDGKSSVLELIRTGSHSELFQ